VRPPIDQPLEFERVGFPILCCRIFGAEFVSQNRKTFTACSQAAGARLRMDRMLKHLLIPLFVLATTPSFARAEADTQNTQLIDSVSLVPANSHVACETRLTRSTKFLLNPFRQLRESHGFFQNERSEHRPKEYAFPFRSNREKQKRHLSKLITIPLAAVAPLVFFPNTDNRTSMNDIKGIQIAAEQNIFGAETLQEWVTTGGLKPSAARKVFSHTTKGFRANLQPLRDRVDEFVTDGLWPAEAGVKARSILNRLTEENQPVDLIHPADLASKIAADPDYLRLLTWIPLNKRFTLELWMMPQVQFSGQSDTHWIKLLFADNDQGLTFQQLQGLKQLREFYYQTPGVSFVVMSQLAAHTLDEQAMIKKMWKARGHKLPFRLPTFARADFPLFSMPETFHDTTRDIMFVDEVDRWKVILEDPRFKAIAARWRSGAASDFTTLEEATALWRSLDTVRN
jgi:hypothetical protein